MSHHVDLRMVGHGVSALKKKKRVKSLTDFIAYLFVAGLQRVLLLLPYSYAMKFAGGFARLAEKLAKKPRRIIYENLRFIYDGQRDEESLRKLCSDNFRFQSETAVDALLLSKLRAKADVDARASMENFHLMEGALAKKRGVLFLAAHFNDGGMGLMVLACRDYPVCMIYRPFSNKRLMNLLLKPLENFPNVRLVPRGAYPTEFYVKLLSENTILTTAVDQHAEEKAITIPFMGKPAQTACGWAVLAQKSGAKVLVGFCLRDKDDRYRFIVEDPGEMTFSGDTQKDLYDNTLKVNKIIEDYVYKYPEQWFWMHKRWKQNDKMKS